MGDFFKFLWLSQNIWTLQTYVESLSEYLDNFLESRISLWCARTFLLLKGKRGRKRGAEVQRLVSSMPFWFPFHLLVLFYNRVNMLKSCWPIHFQIISPTFQEKMIKCVLPKTEIPFVYREMLSQMITFNHFSCHLNYFSSCK